MFVLLLTLADSFTVRCLLRRPFLLLDLHFHDVIVLAQSGHTAQLKKKKKKKENNFDIKSLYNEIIVGVFYFTFLYHCATTGNDDL